MSVYDIVQTRSRSPRPRLHPLGRFAAIAAVIASFALLTGCAIPTRELGAYREASAKAASATEEWWLRARVDTARSADLPLKKNETISDRIAEINERQADIDARFQALEIWKRYDNALLALAEGKSVESIEADMNGIVETLKNLPIERLTQSLAAATPYTAAAAQAIRLVEDAVRAKRFRDAVIAAEPGIDAIAVILKADADSLCNLRVTFLSNEQDLVQAEAVSVYGRIQTLAESPEGAALVRAAGRDGRMAVAFHAVTGQPPPPFPDAGAAGSAPSAAAGVAIDTALSQLEDLVRRHAAFGEALRKESTAKSAYQALLTDWRAAHRAVQDASGQISVEAARAVIERSFELREAWMAAQDAAERAR
jgi:hypothetical protein